MEERIAKPIQSQNPITPAKGVIAQTIETQQQVLPQQPPIDPLSPAERQELVPQEDWHVSPMFYELANFLGVNSHEYEANADKISVITDYAIQEAKSGKIEDIMYTIRELEHKLQTPNIGERRVDNLYRALRMEARYNATKKALGAMTKTGRWD